MCGVYAILTFNTRNIHDHLAVYLDNGKKEKRLIEIVCVRDREITEMKEKPTIMD